MKNTPYKKYSIQAKTGIKGEAYFETLISDYCLPHHIVGPKDLGIDYFCEWVFGDKPSGVIFAVQVKTFSEKRAKPKLINTCDPNNHLEKYEIKNTNLKIGEKTIYYWQGLGIPIYLFAICLKNGEIDCYYRRYTPILTKEIKIDSINFYSGFFKVNNGSSFLVFKYPDRHSGGFARDLFIDYMRWNYSKGNITYMNPRIIGLDQFPENDAIFHDLFSEYSKELCNTYQKTKPFFEEYLKNKA